MTAEAQRDAIAAYLGWEDIIKPESGWIGVAPGERHLGFQSVPDWPGDIPAMHAAVMAMPRTERRECYMLLRVHLGEDAVWSQGLSRRVAAIAADVQSENYLTTLGLWTG